MVGREFHKPPPESSFCQRMPVKLALEKASPKVFLQIRGNQDLMQEPHNSGAARYTLNPSGGRLLTRLI